MNNGELLLQFVDEDFGAKQTSQGRWAKGIEHDSLVVDVHKGVFFFNSRGVVGDPLVYLMEIRGMTFADAKDYLRQYDYSGTHVYTIRSNKNDVIVYTKLVHIFYDSGKPNRDYLYARGITDHTIDRFQIGFYNGWTMLPFFVDGTFRNLQMRRDITSKTFKKYRAQALTPQPFFHWINRYSGCLLFGVSRICLLHFLVPEEKTGFTVPALPARKKHIDGYPHLY